MMTYCQGFHVQFMGRPTQYLCSFYLFSVVIVEENEICLKYGNAFLKQPGNHLQIIHSNALNLPSVALSEILLHLSQMDGYSMMLLSSLCLPSTDVETLPVYGCLELSSTKR